MAPFSQSIMAPVQKHPVYYRIQAFACSVSDTQLMNTVVPYSCSAAECRPKDAASYTLGFNGRLGRVLMDKELADAGFIPKFDIVSAAKVPTAAPLAFTVGCKAWPC